jgi:3-methyl-2-oxobutanoate hydroxymethyltransferase
MSKRKTAPDMVAAKGRRRLSVVTAYDCPSGHYADQSGVDMVLVGDSLAMVVLGHEDTLSVTMEEMLHHTRATSRGVASALLIGDMPFLSYQASVQEAVRNAGRFLKEGRAQAVKLEGGRQYVPQVEAICAAGIPVMGHLGLTPQSVHRFGGYKVQGRSEKEAGAIIEDAKGLEQAGCFALVLECVPASLAKRITEAVTIPTIGIGAGPDCDGQVLVFHDLLGLNPTFTPKFVKTFANLGEAMVQGLTRYREEVEQGEFPGMEHSYE